MIARAIGGGQYFMPDRNGNIAVVTDITAAVLESYRYDAFGLPSFFDAGGHPIGTGASLIGNRFLFTGREYNSQFGFYEYRARAYHPVIGRFMSEDPKMFEAGDYNFYRYCGNDPWDRSDPRGLNWFYINKQWEWHKGNSTVVHDVNGLHTERSEITALLRAKATGTNSQTGATNYKLTFFDQNGRVLQGTGFSGGNGQPSIRDGNYVIRTDDRDAKGPNTINPKSELGNPPQHYGIQRMHNFEYRGVPMDIVGAYGPLRARLNPGPGNNEDDAGDYFHGQTNGHGWTHGCLCYGVDTRMINYMWNMPDTKIGVAVNIPVVEP